MNISAPTNSNLQIHPYRGGFIIGCVIILTVAVRAIISNRGGNSLVPSIEILGCFGIFYILEPLLIKRLQWIRFLYFPMQTFLILLLSTLQPFLDIYILLYGAIALQTFRAFSPKTVTVWMVVYSILTWANIVKGLGWEGGTVVTLLFLIAGWFILSYDQIYLRTMADQVASQALLADLQAAHQKLKEYAVQAEELAAARERNRLARELHDSISQVIFSITLNSQSTRLLLRRNPSRVSSQLDLLQELTSTALSQLRALIAQLRPPQNQS